MLRIRDLEKALKQGWDEKAQTKRKATRLPIHCNYSV